MKEFLKKLVSISDEVSHKRVISIASFVVLSGMVVAKFFNLTLDLNLIYVFASLAGGESVLTVIDNLKGRL
mgnify:CR=1 FL=1